MNTASGAQAKFSKFYKVKKPRKHFLCALCRAPRQMKYSKNLSVKNYFQLLILITAFSWILFPLIGFKGLLCALIFWPTAETTNKLLYRREIPCPYCGFDATWYRRDVKVARQKVEEFWNKNYPDLVTKKQEMAQAVAASSKVNEASLQEKSSQSPEI